MDLENVLETWKKPENNQLTVAFMSVLKRYEY